MTRGSDSDIDANQVAIASQREVRIQQVVDDCLLKRSNGETVDDDAVIAEHSTLMPELGVQLRLLRLVQNAARQSTTELSGLRLRCPVCQAPNLLTPDSDISRFECAECGNPFRLGKEDDDVETPRRTLGRFRLIEKIGAGAYGSVWKAEDTNLKRTVAIKIPTGTRSAAKSTTMMVREARLAAQLRHPNIVAVHEVGIEDDIVYIVTDLIHGIDLRRWLARHRPGQKDVARIGAALADALAHAHGQGVIHRDIKPSNILIDDNETVFITDFGLAKGQNGELTLTADGKLLGTPDYMPPEQIRGQAHAADQRSDVYSLGVVVFELLTGERPFRGDTRMVLHQALTSDPPGPRRLNPVINVDLDTICLKCLEKDPRHRYASASEVRDEFHRYLSGHPILARPLGSIGRVWRWARRNKTIASLGVGLVASLLAIAVISSFALVRIRFHQREALREASALAFDRGLNLCEKGEIATGLLWMERSLELGGDQDNRLESVTRRNLTGWSQYLSPLLDSWSQEKTITCIAYSSDGRLVATGSSEGTVVVRSSSLRTIAHVSPVTAVAFRKDAKVIAIGGDEGSVILYEVETGRSVAPTMRHTERITSLEFSADGTRLLTGCADTFARAWNTTTGDQIGMPLHHQTSILFAKFIDDDSRLVTVGGVRAVVWDAATGTETGDVCVQPASITAAAMSNDHRYLVTGASTNSGTGESRIWDLVERRLVDEPRTFSAPISCVAMSTDGQWVLAGSQSGEVRWWNRLTGKIVLNSRVHNFEVRCATFSADGRRVVTGSLDGTAKIWHVLDGQALGANLQHEHHIWALAMSPNGKSVVTGGYDGRCRVWDVRTNLPQHTELATPERTKTDRFSMRVQFSRDGELLLAGDQSGTAYVWKTATGKLHVQPLQHSDAITALAFSPNRKALAIGCRDGSIGFWETDSGKSVDVGKHSGEVTEIVSSYDGKYWLSGGRDNSARLWDASIGKPIGEAWPHPGIVWFVGFRRDNQMALTSCADGVVRLWDVATGKQMASEFRHPHPAWEAYFTRDGRRLLTGCGPSAGNFGEAQFWDIQSGRRLGPAMRHLGAVSAVALSPDETLVATASFDHSVQIWNMDGKPICDPMRHQDRVWSVAFSPDGRTLLTSSDDHTAQLWDVASGKPVGPPLKHSVAVLNTDFCADNETIATGGLDDQARIWHVPKTMTGGLRELRDNVRRLTGMTLSNDGYTTVSKP